MQYPLTVVIHSTKCTRTAIRIRTLASVSLPQSTDLGSFPGPAVAMASVDLPPRTVTLAVMAYGLYSSFVVTVYETDEVDEVKAFILEKIGPRAPIAAKPAFSFEVSGGQFQDLESGKLFVDCNIKNGSRVNVSILWDPVPPTR